MTVTLPAELAGLLGRTGQLRPDADEDRIVAMADGWNGLRTRLDAVRGEHSDSVRAILSGNTGDAVSAYGDWAGSFDELLLRLVELCARAEALLLAIARLVLAVKKAILDALAALARAIELVKQAIAQVPVIGGIISATIEEVIQPLLDATRTVIGQILDEITELLVTLIVPKLTEYIELVKGLVQDLRKLIKGETGTDWPTTPSHSPQPANAPRGRPETWIDNDNDSTKRARRLENEAAITLAQAGYDVEQQPSVPGRKRPDYRIEGKIFDCVAPTTSNAYNIWSRIKSKKIDEGQTERVIINIDAPDAQVSVDDLRRQFQENPMPGLNEAKVIGPGGAIIDIYP